MILTTIFLDTLPIFFNHSLAHLTWEVVEGSHFERPSRSIDAFVMPKLLILIGIVLIAVGLAWLVGERFGLGRLPGDILIERGNTKIYLPLMTSLVISVVLSLIFWFFSR